MADPAVGLARALASVYVARAQVCSARTALEEVCDPTLVVNLASMVLMLEEVQYIIQAQLSAAVCALGGLP